MRMTAHRAGWQAGIEAAAARHEREAEATMCNLSCGSNNEERRSANRIANFHRAYAKTLRALTYEAPK
jgi:hypothetical protein